MITAIEPPKRISHNFDNSKIVHVRLVRYTPAGFIKGKYIGEFECSVKDAFSRYSAAWMNQHTDKAGILLPRFNIDAKINYTEEFTFCGAVNFSIGVPDSLMYEGINECWEGYPGMIADKYGFEQMFDANGDFIPYTDFSAWEDVAG